MGQKGKILTYRLINNHFWYNLWYIQNFYQNNFFQIKLIKEVLKFFFLTGILTLPYFNLPIRKKNLIFFKQHNFSFYQKKYKKSIVIYKKKYNYITNIKGLYFSKIWILKLANWLIVSIFFYNFKKKKKKIKKIFRLYYFYYSYFSIISQINLKQ